MCSFAELLVDDISKPIAKQKVPKNAKLRQCLIWEWNISPSVKGETLVSISEEFLTSINKLYDRLFFQFIGNLHHVFLYQIT